MADAASLRVGDGAVNPAAPPRTFPDDFPSLKGCRDGPTLASAITGDAATLTSVDLTGGMHAAVRV